MREERCQTVELADGRVLDVANVIWGTGFHAGLSWIELPVLGEGEPVHVGGVVHSEPGLYFVDLHFWYSLSTGMIHGAERDSARIARAIAARAQDVHQRGRATAAAA